MVLLCLILLQWEIQLGHLAEDVLLFHHQDLLHLLLVVEVGLLQVSSEVLVAGCSGLLVEAMVSVLPPGDVEYSVVVYILQAEWVVPSVWAVGAP